MYSFPLSFNLFHLLQVSVPEQHLPALVPFQEASLQTLKFKSFLILCIGLNEIKAFFISSLYLGHHLGFNL